MRIHSFLEKTKNYQRKKTLADNEDGLSKEKEILRKRINGLIKRNRLKEVQKLLKKEEIKPWGRDTQAKVCTALHFVIFEMANGSEYLYYYILDIESFFMYCNFAAGKSTDRIIN